MKKRYYDAGGYRLHARVWNEHGDQPTFVLVHGLVVSSRYMRRLGDELGRANPVLAVDLPGHGFSSKPKPCLTTVEQGRALADFLAAAGIERAVVVSNSYGCSVSIEAAIADSSRIECMVFIGPTGDVSARGRLGMGLRFARGLLREALWSVLVIVPDFLQCGPFRALHEGNEMSAYDIEGRSRLLEMPLHFIRGEHDRVAPAQWLQALSARLGAGDITTIADASHKPHSSKPTETRDAIRSLTRKEGRRP